MRSHRIVLTLNDCIALAIMAGGVSLMLSPGDSTRPATADMEWVTQGGLAAPGTEQVNLVGDPFKPGPYTVRLKLPKGFRTAPYTHPDTHEVTIVSGIYATGYGDKFDEDKLKLLRAGSFYTEPANEPHFIEVKEDVVLQISGNGPSGWRFVDAPDAKK